MYACERLLQGTRKDEECSCEHTEFEMSHVYLSVGINRQLGIRV